MKYIISNKVTGSIVSQFTIGDITFYLQESEKGKDLKELFCVHYKAALCCQDYKSLLLLVEASDK